jgi:hypothetical protein
MTGIVCLVTLLEFLVPILDETGPDVMLLRQHWAPPHFHKGMTLFFCRKLVGKRIGKDGPNISPPHSPGFTLSFRVH